MKRIIILLSLVLITSTLLINQSLAQSAQEHKLKISVEFINPEEFYQGIPLTVQFEIENVGDIIFEGKVTLEMKTEKYSWTSKVWNITGLDIDDIYTYTNTYNTEDDYGRYRATLRIESNNVVDRISLYEGTTLKDEASKVSYETSIFVKSYETYLKEKESDRGDQTFILLAVGTGIAFLGLYYTHFRKKRRK